jgi:hypothetical protein
MQLLPAMLPQARGARQSLIQERHRRRQHRVIIQRDLIPIGVDGNRGLDARLGQIGSMNAKFF